MKDSSISNLELCYPSRPAIALGKDRHLDRVERSRVPRSKCINGKREVARQLQSLATVGVGNVLQSAKVGSCTSTQGECVLQAGGSLQTSGEIEEPTEEVDRDFDSEGCVWIDVGFNLT